MAPIGVRRMGEGNSFGGVGALLGEVRIFELFGTEEVGNFSGEPTFA